MCERYHINRSNVGLPSMSYLHPIRTCFLVTRLRLDKTTVVEGQTWEQEHVGKRENKRYERKGWKAGVLRGQGEEIKIAKSFYLSMH